MTHESYVAYLTITTLAILVNGGDGDWMHYAIQLYLLMAVLLCYLGTE
jgi:hypothetical protein